VKGIVSAVRMRQYLRMDWQDAMPFAGVLGIEPVGDPRPDEVRARLEWREELCTAGGVLHGGALMGFADSVGGVCAFLNLPDGAAGTATIQSSTSFLRPVREGYAEAISRPLSVGRNVIAVETEVVDARGRAIARVVQSQAVLR
jgi:1,4-dihydroxy-2-naphthoyl-CoA hydrolase